MKINLAIELTLPQDADLLKQIVDAVDAEGRPAFLKNQPKPAAAAAPAAAEAPATAKPAAKAAGPATPKPAAKPAAKAAPAAEEAAEGGPTLDDAKNALTELVKAKGMPHARNWMDTAFALKKITDLTPEKYQEFIDAAEMESIS